MQILTDLIFPPRCAVCDAVLPAGEWGACRACKARLRYIREPRCLRCGGEMPYGSEEEYCGGCAGRKLSYEMGFPLLSYVPPVSDAVAAMKYHGRKEYAAFYASEMLRVFSASYRLAAPEAVIPVPVSARRLRKRGYNQAELLAEFIAEGMQLPMDTGFLRRIRNTKPQKTLGSSAREDNLRASFLAETPPGERPYRTVLLVDDIYTTGATVNACAEAMKAAGVQKVYYTSVTIVNRSDEGTLKK